MKLTWYGTAGLVLQEGETAVAFDPFCGIYRGKWSGYPRLLPYEKKYQIANSVFVTHGHFDHIYHIPRLYSGTRVAVYCTKTPAMTLLQHGFSKDQIHVIAPGWSADFGVFSIQAWQGRHCRFDVPLLARTIFCRRFFRHPLHLLRLLWLYFTYPEKGEILFYEVACNGLRIQIMGSMNLDDNTHYPTGADVLVLPLQGRSDQDTYALKLVKRLRPKKVYLDHYDNTFAPLTSKVDVSGFMKGAEKECRIPCIPLRKGSTILLNT